MVKVNTSIGLNWRNGNSVQNSSFATIIRNGDRNLERTRLNIASGWYFMLKVLLNYKNTILALLMLLYGTDLLTFVNL